MDWVHGDPNVRHLVRTEQNSPIGHVANNEPKVWPSTGLHVQERRTLMQPKGQHFAFGFWLLACCIIFKVVLKSSLHVCVHNSYLLDQYGDVNKWAIKVTERRLLCNHYVIDFMANISKVPNNLEFVEKIASYATWSQRKLAFSRHPVHSFLLLNSLMTTLADFCNSECNSLLRGGLKFQFESSLLPWSIAFKKLSCYKLGCVYFHFKS